MGTSHSIAIGDLVYLKVDKDKTKCRDKYIVIDMDHNSCKVRKFTKFQLHAKAYDVKLSECYPVTSTSLAAKRQQGQDDSDSDSSDEDNMGESSGEEAGLPQLDDIMVDIMGITHTG